MRLSKGFWQTYKETPADAEIPSHRLMVRAGLIHKSGAGLYSYLPFGYRVVRKVEQIVREEMDKISNEILMTVVTPAELWKESGRWQKMAETGEKLMLTFKDKKDRDLCISPTNEESVADIFRQTIKSYKNLPVSVYQINTKFRDEIRPRFGLMRGREFTMKDAYSFHVNKEQMDEVYEEFFQAYTNIFNRMGFEFFPVEADAGAMGTAESKTHEFQAIAESGEDEIIFCAETGYAANIEKAKTLRQGIEFDKENTDLKEVATPNMATIEDVCHFLKKPQHQSLKSLVYEIFKDDDSELVLIQLLGDDNLNELKLVNYFGADEVRPATDGALEEMGMPAGFIGPYGLKKEIKILIDEAVELEAAYIAGALKVDTHYEGLVPKRDVKDFEVVDLRTACAGDLTSDGKGTVSVKRGIELGHIFQLGDLYTKSMGITVLDQNGKAVNPTMGCYGIGVTRTVAAAVEAFHDDNGIIWPKEIAPYHVYFAAITKSDEYNNLADEIYNEIQNAGIEVVYDDRKAGPGFKFKDSDLLGLPLRVVLGERDYKNDQKLEIVIRKTGEKIKVDRSELIDKIKELLA